MKDAGHHNECKYNHGILCELKHPMCGGCAWNPDVDAERRQKVRERFTRKKKRGWHSGQAY